ncbi:MAG: hypothetical protein FWJ74_12535 [Gemmatimonadota bacterium]|jgi:hypothetical protein
MRRGLWLIAALLTTQAGCEARLTETQEFAPLSELRLNVTVSRKEVMPGDTLSIRVTAYNPAGNPVQWPEYSCMPLMYRVYTPTGDRIAPPGDQVCFLTIPYVPGQPTQIGPVLEPGDSLTVVHQWAAIHDYGVPGPLQVLDPGAYMVVGGVAGEPNLLVESAPDTVWVRAP